ncbi:hypothetical protein [Actinomycetospora succinea]|uniref:hypothetical protein n=1 Tax=Actinomycetospora succinea TaxID=663603 RepID=UPI00312CB5FC
MARGQQHLGDVDQLGVGQRRLGVVHESGEQVVGRVRALRGDEVRHERAHPGLRRETVVVARGEVQRRRRAFLELGAVGVVDAEQVADDERGQRQREVGAEVGGRPRRPHRVDQLDGVPRHLVGERAHAAHRELPDEQLAQPGVLRRVHHDEDAVARTLAHRRADVGHRLRADLVRGERERVAVAQAVGAEPGVAEDGPRFLVARDDPRPRAVRQRHRRDRALVVHRPQTGRRVERAAAATDHPGGDRPAQRGAWWGLPGRCHTTTVNHLIEIVRRSRGDQQAGKGRRSCFSPC